MQFPMKENIWEGLEFPWTGFFPGPNGPEASPLGEKTQQGHSDNSQRISVA